MKGPFRFLAGIFFSCLFLHPPARGALNDPANNDLTQPSNGAINFQTDLFTGRLTYGIPIAVPPGRQNSQPGIGLSYNSSFGNGWCGAGWMLDMGYIQRDLRSGVPRKWSGGAPLNEYDDSKGFVVSFQGINTRLILISGSEYRAEIDNGSFLKFEYSGSSWTVTDKSGNKFYFGESSASRMEHPNFPAGQGSSTFRWALNRARDINGNETTLSYTKDLNQLYLGQIAYNANVNTPALPATHTVDFVLESRTDTNISFQTGYRVTTAKRLKEIAVKIGATKVRRYALGYSYSTSTYRSLLTSVTQFGADDVSSLPPTTLNYQVKPFEFEAAQNWGPLDSQGMTDGFWNSIFAEASASFQVGFYDIDGDGLPDRVMRKVNAPFDNFVVQFNNGSGFQAAQNWGPLDSQGLTDSFWNSPSSFATAHVQVSLYDIDADGRLDRVMRKAYSPFDRFVIQRNNGAGFDAAQDWGTLDSQGQTDGFWNSPLADDGSSTQVALYDINGDALPDRVMRKANTPYNNFVVQLNTGTGFASAINWGPLDSQGQTDGFWNSLISVGGSHVQVGVYDINGDGLPDRVMRKANSPYNNFVVQFNNGSGFEAAENWGPLNSMYGDGFWNSMVAFANGSYQVNMYDINGDGLIDRVLRNGDGPFDRFKVQLNTGSGFGSLIDWTPLDSGYGDGFWNSPKAIGNSMTQVDMHDVNGDGLLDRVLRKGDAPYNNFRVQLNKGPFPDLLQSIHNGIGGEVTVAYKPSTEYDNRDRAWTGNPWSAGAKSLLPFPVWTVSSVTVNDGLGNSSTTTYAYKNGMYEPSKKEFRGFNRVEVVDPLGTKTITWFHQGGGIDKAADGEYQDQSAKAKQGIPYRTEVWGNDGLKYSETLNKVEETQLHANGWYFPFVSQTVVMDYEGSGAYRAVAKQFTYDTATLNLIKESSLGEVTNVNFQNHTFSDVGSDDVYAHTAYATLSNPDIKNKPSSIKITSDSAGTVKLRETLFTVYDQTRGNLKESKQWLDNPSGYVTTSVDYDPYGNPITATDPVGIVSTAAYDATYKTFAVSQVTSTFTNLFTYDERSGAVTQATDPKGLVAETTYDTFFRPTQTAISTNAFGPAVLWREKLSYSLGGVTNGLSYTYVRKQLYDPLDTANGFESYAYSDGLGRPIQARTEAETGDFRVVDTFYNERGQPELQTLPIFSSGSAFTQDQGQPGTATEYDAIGRAFRVTPPAGDSGSPTGTATTAFKDGSDPWVVITTDPEGKVRKTLRDAYGRTSQIVEVASGGNLTTTFAYNKVGEVTQVTDHNGNATSIVYDSLGRKTSMTEPNMGTWSYAYDLASRLTQQTDAKNQKAKFFYADSLGRMTSKEIWNASNVKVATITYTYDTTDDSALPVFKGQLAKIVDRQGWQKFGYDIRGRSTGEKRYVGSPVNYTGFTQRTFDDADRLVDLTYPTTPSAKVRYSYDTGGNLDRVESLQGTGTTEVFYDAQGFNALGQPLGVAYGNGLQTTYSYFANSKRLERIQTTKPGGGYHQDLSYTYDKVSNVKSIVDGVYSGSGSATISSLQYDDLHRLTSLTSAAQGTKNYSYNAIGNIVTNGEFGGGNYTYGTKPHAVTAANGKTYGYDACGNMTNRNGTTLQYDEENQLKQYGSGITFGYDDAGQRLWKRNGTNLTAWLGGIAEYKSGKMLCHVLAGGRRIATFEPQSGGAQLWQNTPVLAQIHKGVTFLGTWPFREGRTPMTVALFPLVGVLGLLGWSRRSNGASRFGLHERHLWKQLLSVLVIVSLFFATTPKAHAAIYNPVFYYYAGDHLGSSNVLMDRAGDLVQHYEYTGYGKEQFKDNTSAFSVSNRYTDQILDEDTGLYYYNSRYYDPELARFIQPDTLVPSAGDPQTLNRYSYVANNPFKYVDPSGHDFGITAIVVGALIGAAIGAGSAAATGGDIGLGAAAGFVGGLFGGAGIGVGGFLGGQLGSTIGGAIGGAMGGAAGAAIQGGNIGLAAGIGFAAGGLFGYLDPLPIPDLVWTDGDPGSYIAVYDAGVFAEAASVAPEAAWGGLSPEMASALYAATIASNNDPEAWYHATRWDRDYPAFIASKAHNLGIAYYAVGLPTAVLMTPVGILKAGAIAKSAPFVEQYSLRALEDGLYPVMKRGYKQPQGSVWLNAGDVWKYGTTQNPATRYTGSYLERLGVVYRKEFSGTLQDSLAIERAKILQYKTLNGKLPPGNKIVK